MTDAQAPPPDPVAVMQATQATWLDLPASWPDGRDVARKLAEMLASRYSAQPTPRDVDVAKVAYAAGAAAERERWRHAVAELGPLYGTQANILRLLEGDTDGQ